MKSGRLFAWLLAALMMFSPATVFAAETFPDVPEDAYYAEAVTWALDKEITNGKNGVFAPDETVTRAQAVTFLWRMAGRPEPAQAETFPDVETDANNSWYKTAAQWAVERGVVKGYGDGSFKPATLCTRGMILTMLYRMENSPYDAAMEAVLPENNAAMTLDDLGSAMIQGIVEGVRSENAIADVEAGKYYELPIIWAMFNGLLSENQVDTEARTVQPHRPCPRGEMVYFLMGTSRYEEALAAAEEANRPPEPIETGTVPETVALDKDGVKITVTGIEYAGQDVWLDLTIENNSGKELAVDAGKLFVNTFSVSPSTFIPVPEEWGTSFEEVVVPAGEVKQFHVGLNSLREKGIASVYEVELQMGVFLRVETEDGYESEEFAVGEPINIHTSLYDSAVSYDMAGTTVYDKDGLKVAVCRAENKEYRGPQIAVFAYNSGSKDAALELSSLKLDGETVDAHFSMDIPAGKRNVDTVSIEIDYENIPVVKEAELTLQTLDLETWEPVETFEPVTVTFENPPD